MKPARLAIAVIAVAAGAGAVLLFGRTSPPAPAVVQVAPSVPTNEVLIASRDLPMGTILTDKDLAFQAWPKESTTPSAIKKDDGPNVEADIAGSVTRAAFLAGEPIRRDKIVKGPNSGFLSAILPTGMRAVAINIDSRGSSSAGNFILPNDHVDLIHTYRDVDASKASGAEVFASETILKNVRVLAIGPNIQEKNGEQVVTGETATLELDSHQSELVTLAQRVGQLSLTLRSMLDSNEAVEVNKPAATGNDDDKSITIVRYGVATQTAKH